MQNYTKLYLNNLGIGEQDLITCEACGKQGRVDGDGFDLHHIYGRIGDKLTDLRFIMCLCRRHHDFAHTGKVTKSELYFIHQCFMAGERKVFLK